jgi:hypothetical protein
LLADAEQGSAAVDFFEQSTPARPTLALRLSGMHQY